MRTCAEHVLPLDERPHHPRIGAGRVADGDAVDREEDAVDTARRDGAHDHVLIAQLRREVEGRAAGRREDANEVAGCLRAIDGGPEPWRPTPPSRLRRW